MYKRQAVKSLTLHTAVNSGQEFTIGSAFSDYIEAEIWADPGGSLQITAGDALTYYRQDDAGNRTKVGVFYAEKPTRTKRNSYKAVSYTHLTLIDPGKLTAIATATALDDRGISSGRSTGGTTRFFVSDTPDGFAKQERLFMGSEAGGPVEQIAIETY